MKPRVVGCHPVVVKAMRAGALVMEVQIASLTVEVVRRGRVVEVVVPNPRFAK